MTSADFAAEIHAAPHDWMPRLIYADWLEDQADTRADLIRLAHKAGLAADSISVLSPRREEVFGLLLDEFSRRRVEMTRNLRSYTAIGLPIPLWERQIAANPRRSWGMLPRSTGVWACVLDAPPNADGVGMRTFVDHGRRRIQFFEQPSLILPDKSLSLPLLAAWCDEQENRYAAAVRLWDVDY